VSGAATPGVAAADDPLTTVDAVGRWTLPDLGSSGFQLPVRRDRAAVTVRYRLPEGSRQGRRVWYLIRLHIRVGFRPGTAGEAWISAGADDYAGVMIKFKRTGADRGTIAWNSLDLIRGWVEHRTRGRTVEAELDNYVPRPGVRPGVNSYTVAVRQTGGLRVNRLKVFSDSGLEVTRHGPARLVLTPELPKRPIGTGETFTVGYRLANTGGRAARHVVVGLRTDDPHTGLRVIGADRRRAARVARSAVRTFRLRARQPGRYRILLGADSSASHPRKTIEIPVAAAGRAPGQTLRVAIAVALVAAGAALLLAGRRRARPTRPLSPR
jgi:hypothetical protein